MICEVAEPSARCEDVLLSNTDEEDEDDVAGWLHSNSGGFVSIGKQLLVHSWFRLERSDLAAESTSLRQMHDSDSFEADETGPVNATVWPQEP
jgi:hypothetical protein